jgi:carboxypeptidase C (cathepsin A)
MASTAYVALEGSHRDPPQDAKRLADLGPDEPVEVSIYLKRRQDPEELAALADPDRRRAAMAEQRRLQHADDIRLIRAFAGANGLTVLAVEPARRLVRLAGPAARMEAAFRTKLAHYEADGRRFRGRAGPVSLPEGLAAIVESVLGLDTRPTARHGRVRFRPAEAGAGYLPNQLRAFYGVPADATAAGQCVALIELGGGFTGGDTEAAFDAMGLAPPEVVAVGVDGATNSPTGDGGADGEVALDIQVAGGTASGALIAVYFAPNSDAGFADAISAAAQDRTHRPSVIAISWGSAESAWTAQAVRTMNGVLEDAAELGLSVFAAAGDQLATDGIADGAAHVTFPASSPWAIGCGGTAITVAGGRITGERVWNDGTTGTGGGISDLFPVPDFQQGIGLPPSVNGGRAGRGVPDVAADAAPASGYRIVADGQIGVAGGTSAVAPFWGGLAALINAKAARPLGFFLPTLYGANGGANGLMRQITTGDNRPAGSTIGYDAGGRWNACTGLGVPIGAALYATLAGSAATESGGDGGTIMSAGMTPPGTSGTDVPCFDPVAYGNGPDDSVTDATENAAITHHAVAIAGRTIRYTAVAGHLVTVDAGSSKPAAKIFYVAFTEDGVERTTRPVTFFYNGGPGSSAVYVLLGSFAPRRIRTAMPGFTPPAPYTLEDNPDSLLDRSDLVFINPVGTGYSAAIAPYRNRDFWGVDQDAGSLKQFIKRYLTANDRWNSPKFLFGESYGTARSAVLAYALHEDGVDLNGVTLQSSILDYAKAGDPVGLLPTWAADAWYHKRVGVQPVPPELAAYMDDVVRFADGAYAAALKSVPHPDPAVVRRLGLDIGIDEATLAGWDFNVAAADARGTALFLLTLLKDQGLALGSYDGRVTGIDTGIAARIDPRSGGNDPTMTAVNGAYTAMWNSYLNDELKFTSTSSFTDLNDQAFANWDFHHIDPTGAEKGVDAKGNVILYTAGDLAAVMSLNVDLKVFSANGYYDSVTPFHQTVRDLDAMPLTNAEVRKNLMIRYYPSGHMVYLDGGSRTAMKADLAAMYDAAALDRPAMQRIMSLQARRVRFRG